MKLSLSLSKLVEIAAGVECGSPWRCKIIVWAFRTSTELVGLVEYSSLGCWSGREYSGNMILQPLRLPLYTTPPRTHAQVPTESLPTCTDKNPLLLLKHCEYVCTAHYIHTYKILLSLFIIPFVSFSHLHTDEQKPHKHTHKCLFILFF